MNDVVLVHGGFVDGSGWQGVYDALKADGYNVAVVQNPTLSLAGDVAATHQVIDALPGPVTLVGHSYGGVVITEAGSHEKVNSLVYIAAFAPDKGESVRSLGAWTPSTGRYPSLPGAPSRPVPGLGRGPHDPAARPARDGRADRGRHGRGARQQPFGLRLAASRRRRPDQAGRALVTPTGGPAGRE
jgi:pimeloyl-ACP methyl ester carboxylesterase